MTGIVTLLLAACAPGEAPAQTPAPYTTAPAVYAGCDWQQIGPDTFTAMDAGQDITGYFTVCEPAVRAGMAQIGVTLTDDEARAIFAAVAAYSARPYGDPLPVAGQSTLSIADIYDFAALKCDQYNILANEIYRAVGGVEQLFFTGWYGGVLGNHAQIYIEDATPMMIDPTLGLAAPVGIWDMLEGGGGPGVTGVSWHWRAEASVAGLLAAVPVSHREGQPVCSMLYFVRGDWYYRDEYPDYAPAPRALGAQGSWFWPTPGANYQLGRINGC